MFKTTKKDQSKRFRATTFGNESWKSNNYMGIEKRSKCLSQYWKN